MRYFLSDAREVWVRPVERDDAEELQRAFALLSEASRYQRFHTGLPLLGDRLAKFFTDIDHTNHEALVAVPTEESRTIVGVARFIRDEQAPHQADLAFTVAEQWQGRGLATLLLRQLSERARHEGIRGFTLHMLADNAAVLALVRSAGGDSSASRTGAVSGYIDLGRQPAGTFTLAGERLHPRDGYGE